jgi:hypothetical protein
VVLDVYLLRHVNMPSYHPTRHSPSAISDPITRLESGICLTLGYCDLTGEYQRGQRLVVASMDLVSRSYFIDRCTVADIREKWRKLGI